MTAEPADTPVTMPDIEPTVATLVALLAHVPPVHDGVIVVVVVGQMVEEEGVTVRLVFIEKPAEGLPFATTSKVYAPAESPAGNTNWTVSSADPVATAPCLFQL